MSTDPTTTTTPGSLGDLCPPCKLLLNSDMAIQKLQMFVKGYEFLRDQGFSLSNEATAKAIEIICGFDETMDDVLKLLDAQAVPIREEA